MQVRLGCPQTLFWNCLSQWDQWRLWAIVSLLQGAFCGDNKGSHEPMVYQRDFSGTLWKSRAAISAFFWDHGVGVADGLLCKLFWVRNLCVGDGPCEWFSLPVRWGLLDIMSAPCPPSTPSALLVLLFLCLLVASATQAKPQAQPCVPGVPYCD